MTAWETFRHHWRKHQRLRAGLRIMRGVQLLLRNDPVLEQSMMLSTITQLMSTNLKIEDRRG